MDNDLKTGVSLLKQGLAPGNGDLLSQITVETGGLADFIADKYFREYIAGGGSKIKFVTGKAGSGKTHFLQLLNIKAREQGFTVVGFSARDVWLHDFKEIYAEIFGKSDLERCLKVCAEKIVSDLGYDFDAIPAGMTFADYLSSAGEFDALIKKEIRNQLRTAFANNPIIDNNFAIACTLLTGGILGHPMLESSNRELLLAWMSGDNAVKLPSLRKLGLSPSKITKYNARHMLRSLTEVHRMARSPGIIVFVDNMEVLIKSASVDVVRYTKLRREDAYESFRELIDEIDSLRNIMFVCAFDRELIDDELYGVKSYQALWLRIQNEIIGNRFNHFSDIIDLDRFASERFTKETLLAMSRKIADAVNQFNLCANGIGGDLADAFLSDAKFAKTSLPRQVALATVDAGGSAGDSVDAGSGDGRRGQACLSRNQDAGAGGLTEVSDDD